MLGALEIEINVEAEVTQRRHHEVVHALVVVTG